MREIKFRAWDIERQKIYPVTAVLFKLGKVQIQLSESDGYPEGTWTVVRFKDVKLVEYIGQKDKNGVEIYEGDIVRCFTHSLSKVEIKKGCFGLTSNGLHEPYFTPFTDVYGYCEVLGNIYENSELLEETK